MTYVSWLYKNNEMIIVMITIIFKEMRISFADSINTQDKTKHMNRDKENSNVDGI